MMSPWPLWPDVNRVLVANGLQAPLPLKTGSALKQNAWIETAKRKRK